MYIYLPSSWPLYRGETFPSSQGEALRVRSQAYRSQRAGRLQHQQHLQQVQLLPPLQRLQRLQQQQARRRSAQVSQNSLFLLHFACEGV